MAAYLQELRIRVKPNPECARDVKRLVTFNPESMICGYEYNKDACQVSFRYHLSVKFYSYFVRATRVAHFSSKPIPIAMRSLV